MSEVCNVCGKQCASEAGLKKHMEIHQTRNPDRKKRIPLGAPMLKLTTDVPRGKVGRWVNDKPGRIQHALNGGYELVHDRMKSTKVGDEYENGNTALDSSVSRVVGTDEGGRPLRAYLMVIDEDLYKEDQKAKQAEIDRVDKAIKTGNFENQTEPGKTYGKVEMSVENTP